ncbi:MAG: hypothetical protein QOK05_2770 [Chloroflexota bacterium]|jgi:hypothetical protein|nr:hypothetical protein [Chloroflexota bacterium]
MMRFFGAPVRPRKRGGRQGGQAVLELALSMGVLGALLIGALTLGRYAYDRMIVREAMEESAKMAMIDRPKDGHAWQMSNQNLLDWQRAAAHEMDTTIKPENIRPVGGNDPWKYSDSAHNTPGAAGKPGLISQLVDKVNGFLDGASLPHVSQGGFTRAINPGAETMRVMFKYDSGLSTSWTWDSEIDFDFTRYTMFTLPFSPEEPGDFPGEH